MREFELYGTVRAIVCICDSINYLESEEDLLEVLASGQQLSGSRRNLRVRSEHTLQIPGDPRRFRDRGEPGGVQLYLGKNTFYEEDGVNEYDLTIFPKGGGRSLSENTKETHFPRKAFEPERVKRADPGGWNGVCGGI